MVLWLAMNGSQHQQDGSHADTRGSGFDRDQAVVPRRPEEDRPDHTAQAKVDAGWRDDAPVAPASGMAVLSALLSLGSVGGCCLVGALTMWVDMIFGLGLAVTPLLALLGVLLGGAALWRIRRAPVPLRGRPLAIAGLFVGIIALVLQGAVLFGAVLPLRAMQLELVPVAGQLVQRMHENDPDAAHRLLADSAAAALRDDPALMARFDAAVQRAVGQPSGASLQLRDIAAGRRLIQLAQQRGVAFDPATLTPAGDAASGAPMPRPVQLVGADGARATLVVFLDDAALDDRSQVRVLDMLLVVSEADWTAQPLLPDGPAAAMARGLGLAVAVPAASGESAATDSASAPAAGER
jgi:hypothetical protein